MGEHDEQFIFEMGYNKGFKDGIKGSIPKADYEAKLTELRSMALRVKHNTGSINTLIDKLDDLLSEVKE